MTRRLLGATLVLSAFLLFLVQPMVARAILPWFGGSASLWTACMLVFQSMLVLGYLYSHALTRFVSTSGQFRIHAPLLVASALLLPPLPGLVWQPTDLHNPPGQIALLLLAVVGLPYLTLSTTAPLLQAWHARLFPERSAYRLYAWSNASSLLALLSYPLLIEPNLTLRHQGQLWSALYVIFVLLCLSCAYAAMKAPAPPGKPAPAAMAIVAAPTPRWVDKAAWLWLPLVASVVLLGATNEVCHDVFVMPFLWIGPLAIYLVTFVLCFQWEWLYQRWLFLPLSVASLWSLQQSGYLGTDSPLLLDLSIWAALLFVFCMICHGELVRRRPVAGHLTGFYVAVALGGALGGVCVALLAPLVFSSFLELPLALAAVVLTAALLLATTGATTPAGDSRPPGARKTTKKESAGRRKPAAPRTLAYPRALALVYLAAAGVAGVYVRAGATPRANVLDQRRNFFGVVRVEGAEDANGVGVRWLYDGRVAHGVQFTQARWSQLLTGYYTEGSGINLALSTLPAGAPRHIGVMGLGVGTMAAFAKAGDRVRFYEIDPQVRDLAGQYFTFMSGSAGKVDVVMGDARLSLSAEPSQDFDVLAMDAFSNDTIPTHLLTAEAFQVYLRHLRPDGILAVNVSSPYFDLRPVLRAVAEASGLSGMLVESPGNEAALTYAADWVLLTRNAEVFNRPRLRAAASPAWQGVKPLLWTDDFVSLPGLLGRLPTAGS